MLMSYAKGEDANSCSNISSHQCKDQTWMGKFAVEDLDWPAYSPDLREECDFQNIIQP